MRKHDNKHHVFPKSRSSRKQTVILSKYFHQSFHDVMGNLLPDEQVEFIKLLNQEMLRKNRIKNCELERLRRRCKK